MVRERWNLLMQDDSEKLSEDEIQKGWHFCYAWDGLLIGPGMGEMESCDCGKTLAFPTEDAVESASLAELEAWYRNLPLAKPNGDLEPSHEEEIIRRIHDRLTETRAGS